MERELFICECGDLEHQFIITDDGEYTYLNILLNPTYNIFKRIWIVLKYICGKRSKFGFFEEILLNPKDANRLQKVINILKSRQ